LDLKIKLIEIDHLLNLVSKLYTDRRKNIVMIKPQTEPQSGNFASEVKDHQEEDTSLSLQSGS
jgi:hypothetical protein